MHVERYNVMRLSNAELSLIAKSLSAYLEDGGLSGDDRSIVNKMLRSLEDRFVDPVNGDVRLKGSDGGAGRPRNDRNDRNDRNGNQRRRIHHDPLGRGVSRDDDY